MVAMKGDLHAAATINGNGAERFPCAVCGKSYLRKRHLQRHMRDECIGIPPRFSCELCPSRFRRKYHMVRHLTSKHSIPASVAQQATGGARHHSVNALKTTDVAGNESDGCVGGTVNGGGGVGGVGGICGDSVSMAVEGVGVCCKPENLSLRKDLYENGNNNNNNNNKPLNDGNMLASPAHSGGACSSSGTHSPLPAHLPTYGLTGAITAISSAAAAALTAEQHEAIGHDASKSTNDALMNVKNEPMSPTKSTTTTTTAAAVAAAAVAAAAAADQMKLDDDWKMKLSLQLISNSLLKERLMNTIPFGTGYNNN